MKTAVASRVALLALLGLVLAPVPSLAQANAAAEGVSLIRLIASPRDYDGKLVRVIGYARIEFEGTALYVHEADDKFGISWNALWLDTTGSEDSHDSFEPLDRQYVLIEGVFDADNTGHMGMFSGAITQIGRHVVWSGPEGWGKPPKKAADK